MTPTEARKALETVIRSHSNNTLHLERITAAWRTMTHTDRQETDPVLAEAIARADADRPDE